MHGCEISVQTRNQHEAKILKQRLRAQYASNQLQGAKVDEIPDATAGQMFRLSLVSESLRRGMPTRQEVGTPRRGRSYGQEALRLPPQITAEMIKLLPSIITVRTVSLTSPVNCAGRAPTAPKTATTSSPIRKASEGKS